MENLTFVLCYKESDRQAARSKAAFYKQKQYDVRLIDGSDIVILDDFNGNPKVANSAGSHDWIVVIASKKPIQQVQGPQQGAG